MATNDKRTDGHNDSIKVIYFVKKLKTTFITIVEVR